MKKYNKYLRESAQSASSAFYLHPLKIVQVEKMIGGASVLNKTTLPSLDPVPDDIEEHISRLLHGPAAPEIEDWLLELAKNSGHLSTSDEMRWRVLCLVWLACDYSVDKAWPYLMWLNMNEPTISTHLSEILVEAVDYFQVHVKMANWQANSKDDRLVTFFKDFHPIPATHKMKSVVSKLMARPTDPNLEVWLADYCRGTAYNESTLLRPWRLLMAAWYAAGFNQTEGLAYLQSLTSGADRFSTPDNELLMKAAGEANALTPMIQLIADCPDPAVKKLLGDFGHPDLSTVAQTILQSAPDYAHLADSSEQAKVDAERFKRNAQCLEEAGVSSKSTLLELACGPFAPQTLLLNSVGYKVMGVDLHIPPGYLPLSGLKSWFKRRQHIKAWQTATEAYYKTLAQQANVRLKWNAVKIKLADLTRLDMTDDGFDAVICANYLQHAPDVNGLLAEAARVLKSGGLFVADIQPYAGLNGAFQYDSQLPWEHLRNASAPASVSLNKWREAQFKAALEKYFAVELWQSEVDAQAQSQLTPDIQAELAMYSVEELTRKQIVVVARKR